MKKPKTITLDPWRVKPFDGQPRKRFRGVKQLAQSIQLVGQVTPIIVAPSTDKKFLAELVDGERRLSACRLGNLPVKAVFADAASVKERFAQSVAANFCRQNHDALEIAEAVVRFREDGRTIEEIAGIFGKSTCWVAQHASLLRLHKDVQAMLARPGDEGGKRPHRGLGQMTFSLAIALAPLPAEKQAKAAKQIVREKMTLAAARNHVRRIIEKYTPKTQTAGKSMSPRARFVVLGTAVQAARHSFDRYATMSFNQLNAIASAGTPREATALATMIDAFREEVDGIAGALRKAGQ